MFYIKKIASLTLIALALNACGDDTPPPPAATTPTSAPTASVTNANEPVVAEVLVGLDAAYPPYDFRNADGQATGFDVEILAAIGEKQGVKFHFMPEKWEKMMENLDNGKFKVLISAFARSTEREQKYQVSNTYSFSQDVLVTLEGEKKIENLIDFKTNNKVITLANTPYVTQIEAFVGKDNPNIIGVNSSFLIIKGLANKEADAAFIDKGVLQYYAKSFPDVKFSMGGKGADFEKYELVILAHKNEAELMNKINAGLDEIIKDGTYAKIYRKWFNEEPKDLALLGSKTK